MTFPAASRFADRHDVVLVGYRGVDGSSKLDCPEVTSAREQARGFLTEKAMRADAAAYKDCAERLSDDGVDLAGYTLPQRVDDLDAARKALGYERVDLLSESAGTRTAMIYAWRYPQRIHRSVMIGANPPGNFLWDAKTTGEQIERYAALCANDASCRARTPDLAASIHSAYDEIPDRWWFLPIRTGNVRLGAFWGLMHATTDGAGPLNGPWTIDTLLAADKGDGSGAWFVSLMTQAIFPRVQVWGDVAAVARSDAAYARRFFATHADRGSVIGSPGTDFLTAGGRLYDSWPASPDENQYTRVQDSNVETLLIGGRLDVATPPQNGTRELLPHLSKGHEVVLPDIGHTDDFWTYQTPASNRLINTYLDSGRVDTSLYTRTPVDFTPALGHGPIAEIVLGAMLALAALTVLSLVLMALRVRWRGPFGRKSSVVLRARVSTRARPGRSVPRLPDRADDERRCRTHRRARRLALRGRADRARRLSRLGEPCLGHPDEHGIRAGRDRRPHRGMARVQRDGRGLRVPRTVRRDRGSDRRCEPVPPRPRHRLGSAGAACASPTIGRRRASRRDPRPAEHDRRKRAVRPYGRSRPFGLAPVGTPLRPRVAQPSARSAAHGPRCANVSS